MDGRGGIVTVVMSLMLFTSGGEWDGGLGTGEEGL